MAEKCYFGFPFLQIFKENIVYQLNTIDFSLQSMIGILRVHYFFQEPSLNNLRKISFISTFKSGRGGRDVWCFYRLVSFGKCCLNHQKSKTLILELLFNSESIFKRNYFFSHLYLNPKVLFLAELCHFSSHPSTDFILQGLKLHQPH